MKTVLVYVALVAGILLSTVACRQNTPQDMLVNKWKLTEWLTVSKVAMSDSLKAEVMKSAIMEFAADNHFVFTGMNPIPMTGTYALSDDGKTLSFTPENADREFVHAVEELTLTRLVLLDQSGNKLVCTPLID